MRKNLKNKKIVLFGDFFLSRKKKVVFLQPQYGGTVAQLVEQRTENPRVTGSIPVGTTTKKRRMASLFLLSFCVYRA